MEARELVKSVCKALNDKKGEDVKVIDISKISVMADYFVIASGRNKNQVNALVDAVQDELEKEGVTPRQREGYGLGNWVLLDFGDIIVHVFDRENRFFYDLDRIWSDGVIVDADEFM